MYEIFYVFNLWWKYFLFQMKSLKFKKYKKKKYFVIFKYTNHTNYKIKKYIVMNKKKWIAFYLTTCFWWYAILGCELYCVDAVDVVGVGLLFVAVAVAVAVAVSVLFMPKRVSCFFAFILIGIESAALDDRIIGSAIFNFVALADYCCQNIV